MLKKTAICYAITLTTGDEYNTLIVDKYNVLLNDLLFKYKKYFYDFQFNLEILDKSYLETKIHYHGYIKINVTNIQQFQSFIREWKKDHFVQVKIVTDLEKWIEYITKQTSIYRKGYKEISRIMFSYDNTLEHKCNRLIKWRRK